MVTRKAKPRETSPPPRKASHTRLLRVDPSGPGASAPSTLPPPPFASEAAVPGLEWWLDAHMALVSGMLWLQQLLDAAPEGDSHADTIRSLLAHTEAVRDALYELYCDAADDRLAPLVGRGGLLEVHVRGSYAWCSLVVGLLATVTTALRTEVGPDWPTVKMSFRQAAAAYPTHRSALRDAVRGLPVDFASPIEP
ncbi:MAG: hypothetical protein ACRELB_10910, partial [Polyangiaceae bacterium]